MITNTANGVYAYVTHALNRVSVINTATNSLVGGPIAVGNDPRGLAVGNTPNGRYVYIANFGSDDVTIINTSTNTVVALSIPVGTTPVDVALTADGNFAYVVNSGSSDISVIDTLTNTTIMSLVPPIPITVGNSPNAIAIPTGLGPVSDLRGVQIKNRFLTQVDLVNIISWQADADSLAIGFRIFRDEALTDLAGSVGAADRQFEDHARMKNEVYTYYVVAFDAQGNQSPAESTVVRPSAV